MGQASGPPDLERPGGRFASRFSHMKRWYHAAVLTWHVGAYMARNYKRLEDGETLRFPVGAYDVMVDRSDRIVLK